MEETEALLVMTVVELFDDVESSELVLEAVAVSVVGGRANDQSPTYRAMGD